MLGWNFNIRIEIEIKVQVSKVLIDNILISCFRFSSRVSRVESIFVKVIEIRGILVCLQILVKNLKRRLLFVMEYMIFGMVKMLFISEFVNVYSFLMVIIYLVVGILVVLKVFGKGVNLLSLLQDIISVRMDVILK